MSEPRTIADVLDDYAALLRLRPDLTILVLLHIGDGTLLSHSCEFGIEGPDRVSLDKLAEAHGFAVGKAQAVEELSRE